MHVGEHIADMTPKARKRALDRRYCLSRGLAGGHYPAAGAERMAFGIGAPSSSHKAYRNHIALGDMYQALWSFVACITPSIKGKIVSR